MTSGMVSLYEIIHRFGASALMIKTWDLHLASVGFIDGFVSADECLERLRKGLDGLHSECRKAELDAICSHIEIVQGKLRPEVPIANLTLEVTTLLDVLQKTLRDTLLYRLDQVSTELLTRDDGGMSPEAVEAFPSSRRELRSAALCQGFDLHTACVFHSMRALEYGIASLVAVLGVSPVNPNWHNILNDCDKAIKGIDPHSGSDWKDKQQFYSELAINFRYFKDAWRNHTMHAKVTFEREESMRIMDYVISFMDHISTKLREDG